jgi:hypothetical protein
MPQDFGLPEQESFGAAAPPALEANTENFLASFADPHRGHLVPFQSGERTRISLSVWQLWQ